MFNMVGCKRDNGLEQKALDWKLRHDVPRSPATEVVIVAITDRDLDQLGMLPWPRSRYARLIEIIASTGAKVICFDMFFPGQAQAAANNDLMARAAQQAGDCIFATFCPKPIYDDQVRNGILEVEKRIRNFPGLSGHAAEGHINTRPDPDGVIRKVPLVMEHEGDAFWFLGATAALRFLGIDETRMVRVEDGFLFNGLKIPTDPAGNMYIHYLPRSRNILEYHTVSDVLEGRIPSERFRNRIILVGQMAHGLPNADIVKTPIGDSYGVEVHAGVIRTILHRSFLRPPSPASAMALSLVCAMVVLAVATRCDPAKAAAYLVILAGAYCLLSAYAFVFKGLITRIVPVMIIFTVGICFAALRAHARAKHLSITDGLTGLYNRRYLEHYLHYEAGNLRLPVSLIMLDVDHFKRYNDAHGHPAGDMALREIASILSGSTRRIDLVARYGGEEFCVVLPETRKKEAARIASRIREHVESHASRGEHLPGVGHITISAGVASLPKDAKDTMKLIQLADGALYQAKRSGRNRVCVHRSRQTAERQTPDITIPAGFPDPRSAVVR